MELPRAVPLVYYLDENLKPIAFDNAAPYLSGEYAGDPEEVKKGVGVYASAGVDVG